MKILNPCRIHRSAIRIKAATEKKAVTTRSHVSKKLQLSALHAAIASHEKPSCPTAAKKPKNALGNGSADRR